MKWVHVYFNMRKTLTKGKNKCLYMHSNLIISAYNYFNMSENINIKQKVTLSAY